MKRSIGSKLEGLGKNPGRDRTYMASLWPSRLRWPPAYELKFMPESAHLQGLPRLREEGPFEPIGRIITWQYDLPPPPI